MSRSLLVWVSVVAVGFAQFCVDDKELVASYQSSFSSGRIWRDDGHLQLELNGDVMSDTSDEHLYHELLVHPAMLTSDKAQHILIIGGAEGATAREVLRHTRVENVTMVDIDKDLVEMCRTHLHAMHKGSFDSPKMRVTFGDGSTFVKQAANESFDAVIVDGVDISAFSREHLTYGDSLFAFEFYQHVHRILSPGGTLVQYMSDVDRSAEMSAAGFSQVLNFGVDIWSYPGWGARYTLAGKVVQEPLSERLLREAGKALSKMNLIYLDIDKLEKSMQHKARRLKGGSGAGGGGGGGVPWYYSVGICGLCFLCKTMEKKARKLVKGSCAPGDAVEAVWAGNGEQYPAVIEMINAGTITVNWDDGDTEHRVVDADKVFKNGVACSELLQADEESTEESEEEDDNPNKAFVQSRQ